MTAAPPARTPETVLIAGGGLAGLAAALRLREAGLRVTLLEARTRLGGRASSFEDPADGRLIDNCQHVLMGCCTNLLDFYRRLGVTDRIAWHDRYHFLTSGGRRETLAIAPLPAPLHFAPSMLTFRSYSLREKVALARGMNALIRASQKDCESQTFAQWLARHRQPRRLIDRFWNPVIVSACNLPVSRVSAAPAIQVFRQGFLANRIAPRLGLATCPLAELYAPAASHIDDLRLRARVELILGSDRVEGVRLRGSDEPLTADAYLCALPFEAMETVLDPALIERDPQLAAPARLQHSPILGVHLWFDRPLSALPHAALPDHQVQWLFFHDAGRSVHAVISAADEWMPRSHDEILARVLRDLYDVLPDAVEADLLDSRIVKERRATFAPTPGSAALRPGPRTAVDNLFLAGDYCETGWPATMEGAVRSGYRAAAAILGLEDRALLAPDLQAQWGFRLLGGGGATTTG